MIELSLEEGNAVYVNPDAVAFVTATRSESGTNHDMTVIVTTGGAQLFVRGAVKDVAAQIEARRSAGRKN